MKRSTVIEPCDSSVQRKRISNREGRDLTKETAEIKKDQERYVEHNGVHNERCVDGRSMGRDWSTWVRER